MPSANAILNPSSNTMNVFGKTRSTLLENLRGGGDRTRDDKDNVLEMDDIELDAYIEFLLADGESSKEKKNPFRLKPRQVQEEPIDDDESSIVLVPGTDQQEETDSAGPIYSENVLDAIDALATEFVEPETMEEAATGEVEPIHSVDVQDETDTSTIDSRKPEPAEESYTAVEGIEEEIEAISESSTIESMEVEIEEISECSTIAEQDEEDISSEIVEDEIASTLQAENEDLHQAATSQESVDAPGKATVKIEIELTQENTVITTGRSSLWGKLFKSLATFEQDDSQADESAEEATKEQKPTEVMVPKVAPIAESNEENSVPSPSLRERCHAQWKKLKSSFRIKSSNLEPEVGTTFAGREPQRDYTKIYRKYYAEDNSNKSENVDTSSETDKSSKASSSWFEFFSNTTQTKDGAVAVDDSTESIEDCEANTVDRETTIPESDEITIVEEESIGIERQVLSLDRIKEVSQDDLEYISSKETRQHDEDQSPVLSLEIPTESAQDNNEEISEKAVEPSEQDHSVVLSLEIPVMEDTEEVDEGPILQAEDEAEDLQDSTVFSLDIPVVQSIKHGDNASQFQDAVEGRADRVVLSLDIPVVAHPTEDDEIVLSHDDHDTVVLSLDIPVANNAEEGEVDLSVDSKDDATSRKVGRLASSLDLPPSTVEIVDEASDHSVDQTLILQDDSDDIDEMIYTDPDAVAQLDIDTLNTFDLDASDENDSPTDEMEDDESLDDILQTLDFESAEDDILQEDIDLDALDYEDIEAFTDQLLKKPKIQKKLGIADRGLMTLFVLLVFLEEMLKTYILPPIQELVDWGLYQKPPPLFREDFSLRKILGGRGGAAKPASLGSAKVQPEDEIEDEPKDEESEEGSDLEAVKRSTKTNQNEATPSPTQQNMPVTKARPNLIYRYLLGHGLVGHSIIMASIFSIEWIETYLPALTFFVVYVKRQVLGTRQELREVEESFASQTTGFVDGTGSTVRGRKKKKAQTQKDDQQALEQLNRLGDASQARYYFVSNAFMKRHAIGPYSRGTSEITVEAEASDVDQDDDENDEDWVFEALTRKESATEPSVDVSISSNGSSLSAGVSFGFGEKRKKSRKGVSISKVALSSASTRTVKSRKPAGQRVSDRESGVVGRIRAVGANSFVGRSILGAYPGDVPPPDEAADPNGLLGLASKYGYGDWSDVDWSDADDSGVVQTRRKTRRKRKSVSGSVRKPKKSLVGLGLDEIGRDTLSSRSRRTRSAAPRPKPDDEGVSTGTKPIRKTRIRRKKLPSTSTLKKAIEQKDAANSSRGSKVLKAQSNTTSGSTLTGPAIESMKESVKLEPKPDAFGSSESSTEAGEAHSDTATASSGALKKEKAQKDGVKSTKGSDILEPAIGSAVAGSAIQSLKEKSKSKADVSSSSASTTLTGQALSSLKKSENVKKLGTPKTSSSVTGSTIGYGKESGKPTTGLCLSSLKKSENANKPGTSQGGSSVAGPAIGSIMESATKARSGVANAAIDSLKKKTKEKAKSSILDPKQLKTQTDRASGNQDTK